MIKIILIILICIILFIFFVAKYKENFNSNYVVQFGKNLVVTNKNIFYGFNEKQAETIKSRLENLREIDISKSNLIIDSDVKFNNISIDNNKIDGNKLNPFKYHSQFDNRKIIFKDSNNQDNFYNHHIQQNSNYVPNKLCIGEQCIDKNNLSMINGNQTIKLKHHINQNNFLQPHSVHYSGLSNILGNRYKENGHEPQENIFYGLATLENPTCDSQLLDTNFLPKYRMFSRFGLQAPNGQFLRAYPNGHIDLQSNLLDWETFTLPNESSNVLRDFLTTNLYATPPIGILSYHGKYLCGERHWFYGCQKDKPGKANWNRGWWRKWEKMGFYAAHDFPKKDLFVYIFSWGCPKFLTTEGYVHFVPWASLNPDFCRFKIIPIYDYCSEDCKADYLSTQGCCGSNEKNIPKELTCPRQRPKCRFYNQEGKVMGKCFHELPNNDAEGIPKIIQMTPHHCKFAKANESGYHNKALAPELTNNDTMYNEFTIEMAKNEKNKVYEKDIIRHFHEHNPTTNI